MSESYMDMIERLFDCFNRRDEEGIVALCDETMQFFPIVTAEAAGRDAPYSGRGGLHDYLADVAQVWEELLITPSELEQHGGTLFVRGRVYARSRELGIRDMPVAWIWTVEGDRFVRGEVFPNPEQGVTRFTTMVSA